MVYIPGLARNEQMALAKVSGTAVRITIGIDRRTAWPDRLAVLAAEFDGEDVPAERRPLLLGVLLGISRANAERREILARLLYSAAGADPAVAAQQEEEHRAALERMRGGPRH